MHQKLCSFKSAMLKTLNSNFLECEDICNKSNLTFDLVLKGAMSLKCKH